MAPFALLHIPHSSKNIPEDARASLKLTEKELNNELLKMTDSYTNELFRCDPQLTRAIVFPVSRLVVDPERFLDDEKEEMAKKGMGVVYTKTSGGQDLRSSLMPEDKEHLINQYYKPHHAELERSVGAAFKNWGACLFIDCHSFPSIPLSYEFDQSTDRPDICIGTDSFEGSKGTLPGQWLPGNG
jgi:N-formylglutamate amidohydrolase